MAGVHSNSSSHPLNYNSMNGHSEQISIISLESSGFTDSFDESFIKRLATTQDQGADQSIDSVLVKSGCQDYQGILGGLDDLSDLKKNGKGERGNSWALSTAKGSLVDKKKSVDGGCQNVFGMPGKFFCKTCEEEMVSVVRYLPVKEGFWDSVGKLFKMKCCAERGRHPDIVHGCPQCQGVLARITAIC